jgi:hypothetical protein
MLVVRGVQQSDYYGIVRTDRGQAAGSPGAT